MCQINLEKLLNIFNEILGVDFGLFESNKFKFNGYRYWLSILGLFLYKSSKFFQNISLML